MHFLLIYDVVDDYLDRRASLRDAHLDHAWAARESGDLVLAGALDDPPDGAVLVFDSDSPEPARAFAREDPYVLNGLVKAWRVRRWRTVVGDDAETPIHPARE